MNNWQGKRKPRKPLTEEQSQALKEIRAYCKQTKTELDTFCQMFGVKTWKSLTASPKVGERALAIKEHLKEFKRHLNKARLVI